MKYLLIISFILLFLPTKVFATAGINNTITLQGKVTNTDGTNVTDGAYGFEFKVYNGASSGATSLFTETWSTAALFSSTMTTAPGAGGETVVYSGDTNESSFKVGQILWNITKGEPVTITSVTTGTNTLGISPTRGAWATSDTITNQIYVKDGIFRVALNALNQNWGTIDFGDDSLYVGINFNTDGEMKPRLRFSSVPYSMTASNALNLGGIAATGYLRSNTSDTFETGNTLTVSGDIDINGQISIADTDIALDGATTNLSATGDFSINTDDLFVNKSTGNIAIGSASPGTAKLHVTGDIVATGSITAVTNETINGIDISAGTISDATWNGSIIAAQYGGTGANLSSVAQYSVPYFSATGILGGAVAPGTTGYVLATNSTGGAPSWVSADAIAPYQWRLVNEQLSPTNAAVYDVMIGGIATATATISLQANTGAITGNKLYVRDTNATNTLNLNWNENDTADRTLNIALGSGDRYLTLNRSLTVGGTQDGSLTYSAAAGLTIAATSAINQDVQTTANPTFAGVNADAINLGITGAGVIDTDSGNLILATTTDIGSSTTGLRVDTDGNLVDIDDAAVTFGESVAVTGSVTASTTLTAGLVATYDPITISPVVKGTNAYTGTITSEDLTAAHTWEFPNKDGIVAMMSDVTGSAHNAVTLAAIGSSPNANGMTLSTQVLNLEPASVSYGGVVTTGTQSFAGDKTLTGAFVLGDNGDLGSIDTSDWNIGTTGDMTGIGAITADGAISFTPSSTDDITFNVDTDTLLTLDSSVTNADNLVISPYNSGSNTYTGTLTSTDLTGNVTWTLPNATTTLMGNPMTTQGDIIYGGSSGTPTRLAGSVTDNLVLKYDTDTGVPFWGVDNNSGTTYTAGNGLTLATAEFQLGGDLTANTTITQDSAESLSFVNAGTANTIFNLSSSGDMVIQDNGSPFATFTDTGTFILDSLTLDGTSLTSSGALGLSSAAGSDLTLTSRGNSFTLPTTTGSTGYLLSTNGSGTLGWTNPATLGGSGSLFTLTNEQIHPINLAFDLLLGNTATSTATIALQANTGAATVNALYIRDSNASNTMHINWNENDTANRTLNLALGTGDRYLTLNEDFTIGDGFAGSLTYTTATSLTVEAASYLNQDLTTDASPTFAGATLGAITVGVSDDNTITTSTGALTLTPAAGSNLNISLSGTGDLAVNTNDLYVDTSTGYVGIGTNDPQAQLDVYGTTSTLTNSAGDITIDAFSNNVSFASNNLINITDIYAAGSVGIGTTSPDSPLEVSDGTSSLFVRPYSVGFGTPSTGSDIWIERNLPGIIGIGAGDMVASFDTTFNVILGDVNNNMGGAVFYLDNANQQFSFMNGNVGIGVYDPNRALDVLDASNPQLRLNQAEGTVYADFQMNSSGDLVMNVDGVSNQLVLDNGGNVGIGTTNPSGILHIAGTTSGINQYGLYFNPTLSGTTSNYGFQVSPTFNTVSSGNMFGFNLRPQFTATSGGTQAGLYNSLAVPQITAEASQSITNLYNSYYRTDNLSTAGSVVTNNYSLYVANPGTTGTITNNYGLYIASQTGGSTLNYAIYSADGNNYFGGNTSIGGTTYVSKFNVTGSTRFNGSTLNETGFNGIGDQESMVPNSGFEINDDATTTIADAWQIVTNNSGGNPSVTTDSNQGTKAQTLYGTATTEMSVISSCFPVTAGSTYTLYAWAKANTASGDGLYLRLYGYSDGACVTYQGISDGIGNAAVTTSWAKYGGTVTATSMKSAKIIIYHSNPNNTSTITLDSVRLTPAAVTNTIDLAENYYTTDNLLPGQLVKTANSLISGVTPTTTDNDQSLMGIVSTNPAITLGEGITGPTGTQLVKVALSGRVPTIVTTTNGAINSGDYITSTSQYPGLGVKSINPGRTIGTALESTTSWNSATCSLVSSVESIPWPTDDGSDLQSRPCFTLPDGSQVGKIMTFVNPSWYDPDVYFTANGDVSIQGQADNYEIVTAEGTIITRIASFADAIIAKLTVGSLTAKTANIETLKVNNKDIKDIVADEVNQQLAAYQPSVVAIDIATVSSQVAGLETSLTTISTTIESYSDEAASISSRISTLESIAADTRLSSLESTIASLSATFTPQNPINLDDIGLTASDSALVDSLIASDSTTLTDSLAYDLNLDVESIFVSDFLSVIGDTILTTATITNSLTVSSIASLTGNLTLMGNLLTLDSTGNIITITGNLKVTGLADLAQLTTIDATVSGTLTVDTIYNKQLELLASQSAQLMSQVASISSILGLATSSATPVSPSSFAAPTPPASRSAHLPMTLEEFMLTQASP